MRNYSFTLTKRVNVYVIFDQGRSMRLGGTSLIHNGKKPR